MVITLFLILNKSITAIFYTDTLDFIILGVLILQLGQVLDSMDGNLARYRNDTSLRGGFLDRILDGTGFIFVMSSFSWYTYQKNNEPYYIVLGPMVAAFYLIICYTYWNTAYEEQKHSGKLNAVKPGSNVKNLEQISTWKYILYGQKKILSFRQADFYFWIGLGIVLELSDYEFELKAHQLAPSVYPKPK